MPLGLRPGMGRKGEDFPLRSINDDVTMLESIHADLVSAPCSLTAKERPSIWKSGPLRSVEGIPSFITVQSPLCPLMSVALVVS